MNENKLNFFQGKVRIKEDFETTVTKPRLLFHNITAIAFVHAPGRRTFRHSLDSFTLRQLVRLRDLVPPFQCRLLVKDSYPSTQWKEERQKTWSTEKGLGFRNIKIKGTVTLEGHSDTCCALVNATLILVYSQRGPPPSAPASVTNTSALLRMTIMFLLQVLFVFVRPVSAGVYAVGQKGNKREESITE